MRAAVGGRVRVLFVDDEASIRRMIAHCLLQQAHVELVVVQSSAAAVNALQARRFDLVVSDYELGDALGTDVLAIAAALQPAAERWLTSARPFASERVDALRASRFVWKLELVEALQAWVQR